MLKSVTFLASNQQNQSTLDGVLENSDFKMLMPRPLHMNMIHKVYEKLRLVFTFHTTFESTRSVHSNRSCKELKISNAYATPPIDSHILKTKTKTKTKK